MIEIERYKAYDKRHLETRERYWIEQMKPSLNSCFPTQTREEWMHKKQMKADLEMASLVYQFITS
tara:strand:+ start:262 stop:456 length:195 start_codon:yes stop_codon:yes gene_type:complete